MIPIDEGNEDKLMEGEGTQDCRSENCEIVRVEGGAVRAEDEVVRAECEIAKGEGEEREAVRVGEEKL